MKKWITRQEMKQIKPGVLIVLVGITFYLVLTNIMVLKDSFIFITQVFKPLLIALVFAYILNIPMTWIEAKITNQKTSNIINKKSRAIAITLTVVMTLLVLFFIGSIVIPRIFDSMVQVFTNMSKLIEDVFINIDAILKSLHIDYSMEQWAKTLLTIPWDELFKNSLSILGKSVTDIFSNAMYFTSVFLVWFLAFVFSLYLLSSKEVLLIQVKKVILVYISEEKAKHFFVYAREVNAIFKNFITGQLVVAIVVGIFYYLCLQLFRFPYPELIAMIIGVFSLVPVFGPMSAMVIGAFLIASKDIMLAIWFVLFFQIVSQIEDTFIYPKIVGKTVGLPGLWVILSIFILGDLFGLLGMLVAVPLTACIYISFSRFIHRRLKEKQIDLSLLMEPTSKK